MANLCVDKNKCKADGICVAVCPIQILQMNPHQKLPEFITGGGERCINCGHCLASCPYAALSIGDMKPDSAKIMDHANLPDAGQVEMFLKGRRSVRRYQKKVVSRDVIEQLIDIARYAPSGINRQPVNWAVLEGFDRVHELAGLVVKWAKDMVQARNPMAGSLHFESMIAAWNKGEDRICRNAPSVIIAYGLKDDPMVPQSCTIAATYLELAAFGNGLGACWGGYVNMAINTSDEVRKFVGISSRAMAGAVMMLGYPAYKYVRIPDRKTVRINWK